MKKLLIVFSFAFLLLCGGYAYRVQAANFEGSEMQEQLNAFAGDEGARLGDPTDIRIIVARIIRVMLGLLGTVLAIYIIYGGFLWMTAAGSEEKVTKARSIITYGMIGAGVILMAYSITTFVYYIMYKGMQNPFWSGGTIYIQNEQKNYYLDDPLNGDYVPEELDTLDQKLKGLK